MKMICIGFISVLLLSGCAAMQPKPVPLPVAETVGIDPSLLVRCSLIPTIPESTISMGGLFTRGSSLQFMYNTCAIRHDNLIDAAEALLQRVNTDASHTKK